MLLLQVGPLRVKEPPCLKGEHQPVGRVTAETQTGEAVVLTLFFLSRLTFPTPSPQPAQYSYILIFFSYQCKHMVGSSKIKGRESLIPFTSQPGSLCGTKPEGSNSSFG